MYKDMEFNATHRHKVYTKIKFEVDPAGMRARIKGDNDSTCTKWTRMVQDSANIWHMKVKGETYYSFDMEEV